MSFGRLIRPCAPTAVLKFYMDTTTGITQSSGAVTAVADQSGLGNNATCSSPHRPVYDSAAFSSSTKAGIYFELVGASTDWIDITSRISCPFGFSAFVYHRFDTTDAAATTVTTTGNVPMTIIGDNTSTFTNAFGLNNNQVSYSSKVGGSFAATTSSGKVQSDGNNHSLGVVHDIYGNVTLYSDGVASGTASGRTYDPVNTGFNIIAVGRSQTDQYWGNLAEVRVYSGALTAADMTALHSAANTKWA